MCVTVAPADGICVSTVLLAQFCMAHVYVSTSTIALLPGSKHGGARAQRQRAHSCLARHFECREAWPPTFHPTPFFLAGILFVPAPTRVAYYLEFPQIIITHIILHPLSIGTSLRSPCIQCTSTVGPVICHAYEEPMR